MTTAPSPALTTPTESTAARPEVTIDVRRLVIQTVVGIFGFMVGLIALGMAFHEPLVRLGRTFVEVLGGLGVALGMGLPDALTLPIPGDAFSTVALLGGMPFWEVVLWASLGSIVGGMGGYGIGKQLGHMRWFERFMARRGNEVNELVGRYGTLALAAAALTPLPYSLACWASGALAMPFSRFFAVSLLRIVRVIVYVWLIQLGFLTVL
jgi:membrane protein YqaA with SNARE-associated domain